MALTPYSGFLSYQDTGNLSSLNTGTLLTTPAASSFNMTEFAGGVAPVLGVFGAIQSGIGTYFSAKSQKDTLEFQSNMAAINARLAEQSAQSILQQGERQAGMVSQKYGQEKGKRVVSQGSRGIQGGVGSAAEEMASVELAKETDMLQINANAVRAAWGARTQSTNYANQSLLAGTSAESINPFASAVPSMIGSASSVASNWYRYNKLSGLLGGA